MPCSHPFCPLGGGATDWPSLFASGRLGANAAEQVVLAATFANVNAIGGPVITLPPIRKAVKKRLLTLAPCLFTQVDETVTAAGVVHLCEVTLGQPLASSNIEAAFKIQDPNDTTVTFAHPPVQPGASGGDIMEQLCSRLLANEGVPLMQLDADGWPIWVSPSHVMLNSGKYSALKMYGDILIPAAPHNILVSVKSVSARERFLVSGNRLESVGFAFFDQPNEFWSVSRMKLYKRWGFVAIYMPVSTLAALTAHLQEQGTENYAININGKPLYRPITSFTAEMKSVAGRVTLDL